MFWGCAIARRAWSKNSVAFSRIHPPTFDLKLLVPFDRTHCWQRTPSCSNCSNCSNCISPFTVIALLPITPITASLWYSIKVAYLWRCVSPRFSGRLVFHTTITGRLVGPASFACDGITAHTFKLRPIVLLHVPILNLLNSLRTKQQPLSFKINSASLLGDDSGSVIRQFKY